ncbi:50S ribosomal protein L25/general stress protein Ctc [Candidatus Lariskella endosymbiont of Epinotia ramella]|uniref:50S ribosomal protein L25/general stress protein Ctc n=1 Tax=Candidatus Lariskella endosymbiont of Epinotia ramella TaxID=3066224 RepID=UPI0030CADD0E
MVKSMSSRISFVAEQKSASGKGAARATRRAGRIPAIVYGGLSPLMISLYGRDFIKEYHKGGMQSRVIEIKLGERSHMVLLRDIQLHPVTDFPEHIDFQEIREGESVRVSIRVKILNESKCPGIKKGGVLNVATRSVTCYCNDLNIPEFIEVDLENLEIGNSVHIVDIKLPVGITPISHDNFAILSISGRDDESAGAETKAS